MPYWHRYYDIAPEGKEWLTKVLAIATLDWYEAYEERRYKQNTHLNNLLNINKKPSTRPPENALMVALAKELRGLPQLDLVAVTC